MIDAVGRVHLAEPVARYAVALGSATREHPDVLVGASPRSLLQLVRAAKAEAALSGRDFVTPGDVAGVVPVVLPHRLLVRRRGADEAGRDRDGPQDLLGEGHGPAGP